MAEFKYELFDCILAFRKLPMSLQSKTQCLGIKLGEYENNWQVVGITREALLRFKVNDYKMVSRIGIHRAHKIDRKVSYAYMIENELSVDALWEYYIKTNDTILSTATENMSIKDTISHVYLVPQNLDLFKPKRVSWNHSKAEIQFIKNLCEIHNI